MGQADNGFMNDSIMQGNDLIVSKDFNSAAINNSFLDMPTHELDLPFNESLMSDAQVKYHNEMEEDVENINPLLSFLPSKRSRSDKELLADEKRAKESARALLRLIKSEIARVGKQPVSLDATITYFWSSMTKT